MQLAGMVAMITGGASGLGAATARLFGGAGARLALCDLNMPAGNALAAELGNNGLFVQTDVTRSEDIGYPLKAGHLYTTMVSGL